MGFRLSFLKLCYAFYRVEPLCNILQTMFAVVRNKRNKFMAVASTTWLKDDIVSWPRCHPDELIDRIRNHTPVSFSDDQMEVDVLFKCCEWQFIKIDDNALISLTLSYFPVNYSEATDFMRKYEQSTTCFGDKTQQMHTHRYLLHFRVT